MDIQSENPEHGYQFPGQFELCALGLAEAHLEVALVQQLADAGIQVFHGAVTAKPSANGKYVSVRIPFLAATREEHDRAHQVLRDNPGVKWTL